MVNLIVNLAELGVEELVRPSPRGNVLLSKAGDVPNLERNLRLPELERNKYLSILRLKLPIFHFKSHILEPYFLKTDQFVFRFFSIILSS